MSFLAPTFRPGAEEEIEIQRMAQQEPRESFNGDNIVCLGIHFYNCFCQGLIETNILKSSLAHIVMQLV